MQRRGAQGRPEKGQRTKRSRGRKAPTARVSTADLQKQIATLTRELTEAREQQTATSEVLKIISGSPGELKPVFQAMLEKAVQVCGAKFGILFLTDGDGFRTTAMHDVPRAFVEKREREPFIRPLAQVP